MAMFYIVATDGNKLEANAQNVKNKTLFLIINLNFKLKLCNNLYIVYIFMKTEINAQEGVRYVWLQFFT